jgi:hypothetical protein
MGAVRASDEVGGIDLAGIPPATVKPLKVVPLGPFGNELARAKPAAAPAT